MRVVFLGNAAWSVPSLEALAASRHQVELVATRMPRPAPRGRGVLPTPVAAAGRALGLPVGEVATVKGGEGFEALAAAEPDALVVVAYGEILPPAVLDLPRIAPVNLHFSLLPKLRGAAPVQRALLEGTARTGVTTIRMDPGMDTGPILLQREEPIRDRDDAGSLGARLAELGGGLLVETLDGLEDGTVRERPQDDAAATYAAKLSPEDRVIEWAEGAERVVRRVRAMSPEPGAETTFRGRLLKVFRASWRGAGAEHPAEPLVGSVVSASNRGLAVYASDGVVALEEVAPEGRKRMSGGEFFRGYRPEPGEILGPA